MEKLIKLSLLLLLLLLLLLTLGAKALQRIYYSFPIYSPLGKGSYGGTVRAPEVGVT